MGLCLVQKDKAGIFKNLQQGEEIEGGTTGHSYLACLWVVLTSAAGVLCLDHQKGQWR